MKLDRDDLAVLSRLGPTPRPIPGLAADLGMPPAALERRLSALGDNGLVTRGDGGVRRTESGRRVLRTSAGDRDERIDTTPAVERALAGFDLDPATADAVRHAYVLLRYWGRATPNEIVDAVYPEVPAGYATSDRWWTEGVRGPLSALPNVAPPPRPGAPWRYAGRAEVETPLSDGFAPASWRDHRAAVNVVRAVEAADVSPVTREAVRTAFDCLRERGRATDGELRRAVAPLARRAVAGRHPEAASRASATAPTLDAWWRERVAPVLERVPGVARAGRRWRYDG